MKIFAHPPKVGGVGEEKGTGVSSGTASVKTWEALTTVFGKWKESKKENGKGHQLGLLWLWEGKDRKQEGEKSFLGTDNVRENGKPGGPEQGRVPLNRGNTKARTRKKEVRGCWQASEKGGEESRESAGGIQKDIRKKEF